MEITKQTLQKGYRTVAFVQNPTAFPLKNKNLEIFQGDALNYNQVENAINGCEAVISVLGVKLSSKDKFICSKSSKNIIAAMQKFGIKRLIVQSAYGVKETKKGIGAKLAWLMLGNIMKDKEIMEDEIEKSGLNWTIVRPVKLNNGKLTKHYRYDVDLKIRFPYVISRANVADFIISQLENPTCIKKKIIISN